MTRKQQIQKRLQDPRLDAHTRESLQQLLHYLEVEGPAASHRPQHAHSQKARSVKRKKRS
jgi:hypothetical protein